MEAETVQTGSAGPEASAHKAPNYYLIWLYLFVLTVAEVAVAFVSGLPKTTLILVLLGMAIWKAMLVAMYYMHLKFEPRRLWMIAAAPLPLAVILVVVVLAEKW